MPTNKTTNKTEYAIRDRSGRVVAYHVRTEEGDGKRYTWKRPNGEYRLNGTLLAALPLYGIHDLSYWYPDELIVVTEGEKARDALADLGIPAVGTITGAGDTPSRESLSALERRRLVLWADNDDPGRGHMERVGTILSDLGAEVLEFEWEGAPPKGDAFDYIEAYTPDADTLERLLESAPAWKRKASRRTINAKELLSVEFPPLKYAVPGIVPEGVSLLAGKPKLGKSWFAVGLCIAVATGGYALGTKKVEKGSALYLGLEDNKRRLRSRLEKMLQGEEAPEGLEIATEWERVREGGTEALEDWLKDHPDARLVVIDTLAKVRQPAKGQNVYAEDYAALEPLLPLAAKYGVAIVVVTHTRKLAAADPLDEISGSTGLSGGVDGFLVLKRDRGRADAYLHVDGRDVEEASELALMWDQNLAAWTLAGDASEYRLNEQRAKILDVLGDAAPDPLGARDVADAVGEDYNATRQRLHQMNRAGEVKQVARGKYTLPNNPNNGLFDSGSSGGNASAVVRDASDNPNNYDADTCADDGRFVRNVRDGRAKEEDFDALFDTGDTGEM